MFLSEITTSDQLVIAQAAQGYRKIEDSWGASEEALAAEPQGFFEFDES